MKSKLRCNLNALYNKPFKFVRQFSRIYCCPKLGNEIKGEWRFCKKKKQKCGFYSTHYYLLVVMKESHDKCPSCKGKVWFLCSSQRSSPNKQVLQVATTRQTVDHIFPSQARRHETQTLMKTFAYPISLCTIVTLELYKQTSKQTIIVHFFPPRSAPSPRPCTATASPSSPPPPSHSYPSTPYSTLSTWRSGRRSSPLTWWQPCSST